MREMERMQHLLYARSKKFQFRLLTAYRVLHEALHVMRHPYLAFSGGADSLCLLDMLYGQGATMAVRWSDDGYDFPESLTFLQESEQRYGFRLHRTRNLYAWRLWCEEMGRPDLAYDPHALAAWGNPQRWDEVRTEAVHQEYREYDGVFLGLLATESRARRMQLHDGYKPLYQVKAEQGMWHCSPLASWTKQDVFAYLVSRQVPYNPVYDRLAEQEVPLERRRVAPLVCFQVMQYGSVVTLKMGWPDLYNRLSTTFPKVREYV